jgi:transcriptional regulator with GAF, ATPase, and Fis domain
MQTRAPALRRAELEPAARLIGSGPAMGCLRALAARAARSDATVLVTGETGTGKGLVARAIHEASPRRRAPFVHLDCAALAAGTVESELFGHERGAFTGAHERRAGKLEVAEAGTLFLDEIGELEPRLQPKLLRLLQDREFERVGGNRTLRLHARIIAATHRDLARDVAEGRFREDLYYRLAVLPIYVPPLRERREDIPELAHAMLRMLGRRSDRPHVEITDGALARLADHTWPGNVRELASVLERCCVLGDAAAIDVRHVDDALSGGLAPRRHAATSGWRADGSHVGLESLTYGELRRAMEREHVVRGLLEAGGNVTRAARLLGVSRSTLRYRMRRLGLGASGHEPPPGEGAPERP